MTTTQTIAQTAGRFGPYGGRYVPETLVAPLEELERAFEASKGDARFRSELDDLLRNFAGRPTPLQFAARLTAHLGGPRIYLKREDLLHTGAHKINNCLGQGLLAVRMKKSRIVAETGAGQHGVATATVAARLGLECVVYMGTEDMARQSLNVSRMKLLGAQVVGVEAGSRTLKDAINEAMRDWVTNVRTTHYLLGSVLGAHPYPAMVRDFHAVIGEEARRQVRTQAGARPDVLVACVGGGSNALGLFAAFFADPGEMVGVEAGGRSSRPGDHAARFLHERGGAAARPPEPPPAGRRSESVVPPSLGSGSAVGVLHGTCTYLLQDEAGNVLPTHSISAGLDYPAVGPEHALLRDEGRVRYTAVGDDEALAAFHHLSELEGIIPALESAHAVAWVVKDAGSLAGKLVLVNLSGRGDKDLGIIESAENAAKVDGGQRTQRG